MKTKLKSIKTLKTFLFWSYDPASPMSKLTIRITGNQLPDKSDSWSHSGLGFELSDGELVYYENLFSTGFQGPKPVAKLIEFGRTTGRVEIQYVDFIYPKESEQIRQKCQSWVGRRGYYGWQLVSMWAFERFGRFVGTHLPRSPGKGVCSEDVARLVFPWVDLRDSIRSGFDEVNPNSAWRQWMKILAERDAAAKRNLYEHGMRKTPE